MRLSHFTRLALVLAFPLLASPPESTLSPDAALQQLMEGNQRFVAQQMTRGLTDAARRTELAKGQAPYAIILSCSDSRLPPELIFDKGLGELFVVRVAGNIPDPIVLGSLEYGAEHLGAPLLLVLGHERCGAVKATVEAKGKPEGNIGAIVRTILPAVRQAKAATQGKDPAEVVEAAVDANIHRITSRLTKQSKVLAHLVHEGKLKIVSGKYDLDDGKVTLFE